MPQLPPPAWLVRNYTSLPMGRRSSLRRRQAEFPQPIQTVTDDQLPDSEPRIQNQESGPIPVLSDDDSDVTTSNDLAIEGSRIRPSRPRLFLGSTAEGPADISSLLERLERDFRQWEEAELECGLRRSELHALMTREITPEDYETLLKLDKGGTQKVLDQPSVDRISEIKVSEITISLPPCGICLLSYQADDTVKQLPCKHFFHTACIDRWLLEGSARCPLDGKEVTTIETTTQSSQI